jgi:AbrB family looped-hinge helix DNA binding protein
MIHGEIMIATISKGQQITIPAIFREALGLHIGSKVEIEQVGQKIILKSIGNDLNMLFEEAKKVKPKKQMNVEEMEIFTEGMFR